MIYELKFLENSTKDYEDGIDFYNGVSSELAERFVKSFENIINRIENNPHLFQIRYRNIRIANLKIFPFSIHFIIEKDVIFILKILH